MMAILVGVGATRGWRSTLLGAAAGFGLLSASTVGLGDALLRIPIQPLRVAVGALLLILGLQWLKKALLRIARPRARKRAASEIHPRSLPRSIGTPSSSHSKGSCWKDWESPSSW
jgi:uncharacterized membrane protein